MAANQQNGAGIDEEAEFTPQDTSLLPLIVETVQVLSVVLFNIVWGIIRSFIPYSLLPKKTVAGELVVITGAASGIGRLLALRFAQLGSKLALLDVMVEGNEETKRIISQRYPAAVVETYKVDLNDRRDVYRVMDRVKHDLGDPDILVNNAGIVTGRKILECPDELMEKTMNVNATAHFWTIKSVLKSMIDRNHGHIVTVSSAAGISGTAGLVDYCASKFAAFGLTESLALELRSLNKNGVRTTTVCPYYINTGMFHGAFTKFPNLLPILEPEFVADRIMDAILTNQEILLIPKLLYWAYFMRSFLPTRTLYMVADYLGITHSMNDFIGRGHHHQKIN